MAEDSMSPSRKNILCSLDKFYFDNYLNLDERLSLNDNFNQNRYAETQRQMMRNMRKMNTEPPKKVCGNEKEQSSFYPSFFQRIFKSISQNISNSESKEIIKEKEDKLPGKQKTRASFILQNNQKDAIQNNNSFVDKYNSNNTVSKCPHFITDIDEKTQQKTERKRDSNKKGITEVDNTENEEKMETESATETNTSTETKIKISDEKNIRQIDIPKEDGYDVHGKERGEESIVGEKKKEVKTRSEEAFTKKENKKTKDTTTIDKEVICNVFKKKNVKTLVVRDTGGIDIEIIETENPEYLYYTHSGTLVSNMYYEFDDSLRNKEMYNEKKINKSNTIFMPIKGIGNIKKIGSATNEEYSNIGTNKNVVEKDHTNNKKVHKYYSTSLQNSSNENLFTGNEKQFNACTSLDLKKNFSKRLSSESYQGPELLSSFSTTSFNVCGRKKKKYYYVGETYNNKRNGWGMLVFNDRVIFEGEYKMNNALGYFIKYNEYSTEFGYRSPICIQSVSIMSDNDNFITQNKFNYFNNSKKEEEEENNNAEIKMQTVKHKQNGKEEKPESTGVEKIPIEKNGVSGLSQQENELHNTCLNSLKNDKEKKNRTDKLHTQEKDTKNISSEVRSCEGNENNVPSMHCFQNEKQNNTKPNNENIIKNDINNMKESESCKNEDNENRNILDLDNRGLTAPPQSLHVSTNMLRKTSKHKTSPARSIHYLKPPSFNMIKNNYYTNKQGTQKSGKPIIRRSYKCKTTHLITPINIIVTSMDTDNEEEIEPFDEKESEINITENASDENEGTHEVSTSDTNMCLGSMTNSISGSVSESISQNDMTDDKEKDKQLFNNQSNKILCGGNETVLSDMVLEPGNGKNPYQEKCNKEDETTNESNIKKNITETECTHKNELDSNTSNKTCLNKQCMKPKSFYRGVDNTKESVKQKPKKICFLNSNAKEDNEIFTQNEKIQNEKIQNVKEQTLNTHENKNVSHNDIESNKNLTTFEKFEYIKNQLKVKDYDKEYRKFLYENINNDNFVLKNNKITTFRKFVSNNLIEVTKNVLWRKCLENRTEKKELEVKENKKEKFEKREGVDKTDDTSGNQPYAEKTDTSEEYTKEKQEKQEKQKKKEKKEKQRMDEKKGTTESKEPFENEETEKTEGTEEIQNKEKKESESKDVPKVSPFTTSLQNELEKQWAELSSFERETITREEYEKVLLRKKLRGATFPETYGDRQKNCFLFIDDYLTSNEDRSNVIDEECKLRASDYNKWSVNMLYNFLKMIGLKKEAYLFKINQIRGYHILKLTDKELQKMNITNCYVRKFVLSVFRFLVNSLDNADPLSLNFNTNVKFSFDQITNIANSEIDILKKIGGGSYAQVFKARYKNKYVACKIFMYNPKQLNNAEYCESYISTPRSSQSYILPKMAVDENFNNIENKNEYIGKGMNDDLNDIDTSHTLQMNKKIKKMANLEIFRYFPTPVKYRNYEAKILYSLQNCKYVIKLLGVCSLKEGEESIVLQYCHGGSLEKYIYADEKRINIHYIKYFSRPKIVKIFQQVAEGMHCIHCNQYFHRDLKLSNILIDENGQAVISDFGLSTSFSKNDSPAAYAIYGNIFYAAPEVLKGEGFFKESDVWSFAVSLWEALSRKIAYDGYSSSEVYCKVAAGELSLTIPKDIPTELSTLLQSMLDPDFTKRPLFHVIAKKLQNILESAETQLHTDIVSFFEG